MHRGTIWTRPLALGRLLRGRAFDHFAINLRSPPRNECQEQGCDQDAQSMPPPASLAGFVFRNDFGHGRPPYRLAPAGASGKTCSGNGSLPRRFRSQGKWQAAALGRAAERGTSGLGG